MKISVSIPVGQLGPKIMRALGRAFRHLGHEVSEYEGTSLTTPMLGKPDLHVCYNLATRWLPPDVQNVQVWGTDPADDPRAMESVIQRQKDMDLAFLVDSHWLEKAVEDEGLYSGHYLQLGTDTLVEPSISLAGKKHRLGIFGGPYPQRIGELAVLVHRGIEPAIWGPSWNQVPQLAKFHQGVLDREDDLLAAMNSCEVVGILPRNRSFPWSYWQALASTADVAVGFEAVLRGIAKPAAVRSAKRSMIDVAKELLDITTKHMDGHKDKVITHIEVDDPWAEVVIKFPNEGDTSTFDISANGMEKLNTDAVPTILRRAALAIENERTGAGLVKMMQVDDGKLAPPETASPENKDQK